jgi:hypothetical protein
LNPAKATKSNLEGITHVVTRISWYCVLTGHLLDNDNIVTTDEPLKSILQQLEQRVVTLYKAILLYQIKSVCSYYRHQGYNFLRQLASWDDWDGYLKTVKDAEDRLQKDSDQYNSEHVKGSLRRFVKAAENMEAQLGDIRQTLLDFTIQQKAMHLEDKDEKCLQDLYVVDPHDDMEKIVTKKDPLLDDAYKWILNTKEYTAFTNWSNETSAVPPCRLMWVKGYAGTGKTMLLVGIIRELSSQPTKLAPNVSHFFCQGTDKSLNSATATLRSLLWLLLVQQPNLISHLRSKYKYAGSSLFERDNAFIALFKVFKSILKDPDLSPVYFIVDALDECEQGLQHPIQLISTSLTISNKVKWLVSSRPTVDLKNPDTASSMLELDAQRLEDPVKAYIENKISALQTKEGYDDGVLVEVSDKVRRGAKNTFLWVALVFKELESVEG